MEHTLALIEKAHEGDKAARDTLAEENMGLVWSMVRRFANRGVEMEDLCQIGSIGLLKAIDKFDPSFEVCFSTYAVPMIAGEIRRFLRSEGMVKVSRPIRELAWKAYAVRERLERENGRDPTLAEIAGELDVTVEEIVEAMESGAEVESLQKTIYQGENHDISLMDRIPEKENGQEKLLNRIFLEELLGRLPAKERQLIYMRYFQDMTQAQIAGKLGISQVQVSRMEGRFCGRCGWKRSDKNTNPAEGRFSWERQRKVPEIRADKGRKERRSGERRQKV